MTSNGGARGKSCFGLVAPVTDQERLLLFSPEGSQKIIAALAVLLLAAALKAESLFYFSERLLGGAAHDAGLYYWLVLHNSTLFDSLIGLSQRDFFWFDTLAFYPYGETLAWSDNFLLPSFFAWLIMQAGASVPSAYNAVLLTAIFLNGYITFRLAFALLGSLPGSIAAALLMTSSSSLTYNLGHPQLQFLFFIPLGVLLLFRLISKPRLSRGLLFGLVVSAAFYTTVYYSIFLCLAALFLVGALALLKPSIVAKGSAAAAAGTAAGLLPLAAAVPHYLSVREAFGPRHLFEPLHFAASGLSFISAPPTSLLYGFTSGWSHSEAHLFTGFAALLLLAVPLVSGELRSRSGSIGIAAAAFLALTLVLSASHSILRSTDSNVWGAAAALSGWLTIGAFAAALRANRAAPNTLSLSSNQLLAAAGFSAAALIIISLGPLGRFDHAGGSYSIMRVFFEIFPGMDSIRAVSRAALAALPITAVFCGFGASLLFVRSRCSALIGIVLTALLIFENLVVVYPFEEPAGVPAAFDSLYESSQEGESAIVLPLAISLDEHHRIKSWTEFSRLQTTSMLWGLHGSINLVNGYSGQRTWVMKNYPRYLQGFPESKERSWERALSRIAGLRHIVYVAGWDPDFNRVRFLKEISESDSLSIIREDESGNFHLNFLPLVSLNDEHHLLVPPQRNRQAYLHLEFISGPGTGARYVELAIGDERTPLSTLEVPLSGEPASFSVPVPPSPDPVRPQRIYLKAADGSGEIFLRKNRFEIYR